MLRKVLIVKIPVCLTHTYVLNIDGRILSAMIVLPTFLVLLIPECTLGFPSTSIQCEMAAGKSSTSPRLLQLQLEQTS